MIKSLKAKVKEQARVIEERTEECSRLRDEMRTFRRTETSEMKSISNSELINQSEIKKLQIQLDMVCEFK